MLNNIWLLFMSSAPLTTACSSSVLVLRQLHHRALEQSGAAFGPFIDNLYAVPPK